MKLIPKNEEIQFHSERIEGIQFSLKDKEQIKNESRIEIKQTEVFQGNQPVAEGIFDPHLGNIELSNVCQTCNQSASLCCGHFGHIELAAPIFQVQYLEHYITKLLQCVCYLCGRPKIEQKNIKGNPNKKTTAQRYAYFSHIASKCQAVKNCPHCNQPQPIKIKLIEIYYYELKFKEEGTTPKQFWPEDIQLLFQKISDQDLMTFGFIPQKFRPENLIMEYFPIPPPHIRPSIKSENGKRSEDDLTNKIIDIIKQNKLIKMKIENDQDANSNTLMDMKKVLQYHVASFIDNNNRKIEPSKQLRSGRHLKGVQERWKGKEGRVRGNLTGKRVNFSARTVITPDPSIDVDEVGVPIKIAMNLTFPEIVNQFNIDFLKKLVKNGPNTYPGARFIIKTNQEDRQVIINNNNKNTLAENLQFGDKVERHMINGDYVLFNRQPSLHKLSMQGHRIRVMEFESFRLNPMACESYNADFDGDEMNLHLAQSYQTVIELAVLASQHLNVISPKESQPIVTPIQDTVIGLYLLTNDNTRIPDYQFYNLLTYNDYFSGNINHKYLQQGEKGFYTGKQLFTSFIPRNLNITFGSGNDQVVIKNGQLQKGVINKKVYTARSFGVIHNVFEQNGPRASRNFLTVGQKIICNWLLYRGFSVGLRDLQVEPEIVQQIQKAAEDDAKKIHDMIVQVHMGTFVNQSTQTLKKFFEGQTINILNSTRNTAFKLIKQSIQNKNNRIIDMIESGAKGKPDNVSQMLGLLGQQTIENGRVKDGYLHRSLPHYHKYDMGPESRGFIKSSFLQGLTPEEYFFHCFSGREGIIDTAVKTSSSGYMQRQIMKALEDCRVDYRYAVRNANGQIIQYTTGFYGFEPAKLEVHNINYGFQSDADTNSMFYYNVKSLKDVLPIEVYKEYDQEIIDQHYEQILKDKKYVIEEIFHCKQQNSIIFGVNIERIITQVKNYYSKFDACGSIDLTPKFILEQIQELIEQPLKGTYHKRVPLWGIFIRYYLSPRRCIIEYNLPKKAFIQIVETIKETFYDSLAHPNQNIGAVSGQSLGEVLTQMTLNCVSWDTEFLICQEGHYKKIVIGELIDNYMNENKDNIQKTINTDNEPTELLSIKDANILVPSVDEDGKVMWKEIEALSRHPVINTDGSDTILQITTESGRVVKATKGESFLVQKDNKIVPIRGDQLTTEDYLPLTKKLEKICEITHLDITHLFPKDQYIHSNEIITKIDGRRYTNFENTYQQGCLYTNGKMNKGHFPVNIPLDYDFGYLIGAYLADGCLTDNHVLVAKNDPEYFKPIEKWCDKYGIGYWHPIRKYDNPNWQDGGTIRLCSYFTVNIIKHYCGKLSHNKHIHPTLLQAPKQFHKGLIEAYIGGDGSVSRSGYIINVSSVSKQLLEDISTLLSMYNINTYYGKEVTSYYINEVRTTCNVKSNHNIHTLIIQGNNYQKFYLQFNNLPIQHKKQLLQQQYEKSLDYGTQSTKFNMIPGITCGGLDNDLIRREDVQKIPDQRLKEQLLNQQVVYDKIKEIREYKDDKHPLVYDFTVKDTLNYIPYSGICGRDSFHSAGLSAAQESTSGVPRLKELLTVTQNIKTPQNIIYLPPSKRNQMEYALDLKNKIENKYLKDVLISSEIYYDSPSNKDDYSVLEKDNNHIKNFKKFELYNNDIKKGFVLRFTLNRETMYENNIKMIDINLKLKMAYGSKITTIYNDDNDEDLFFRITLNEQTEDVIAHLKALEHSIVNHLSIKGISGINKAYYRKLTSPEKIYNKLTRQWENFEEYIIETAGSNLFEILQLPNIDKTRTISNNIREVHKIYGIEMTRALLEKSIKDVYNQSNAGMSIQHISLLVDIMTHRGNIVQIDRHGINKQDIGPLAKCAFEEVNQVITASTIFAEQEKFKGVIANVMIGQIPRQYGTGASTILMDMEEYISMASKPYKLDDI